MFHVKHPKIGFFSKFLLIFNKNCLIFIKKQVKIAKVFHVKQLEPENVSRETL